MKKLVALIAIAATLAPGLFSLDLNDFIIEQISVRTNALHPTIPMKADPESPDKKFKTMDSKATTFELPPSLIEFLEKVPVGIRYSWTLQSNSMVILFERIRPEQKKEAVAAAKVE
jgi:hypothetical protein